MLHLSQALEDRCSSSTIFLDTNVFILAAQKDGELLIILEKLSNLKAAFVTTTSVVFEYSRGAKSIEEIELRREFISKIVTRTLSIGNLFESNKNDAFSAVMSLQVKRSDSQYTDFLLAVALYKYLHLPGKTFISSTDARAYPLTLFDIEGVISLENEENKIAHLYLISLNESKYLSAAQKVGRGSS